MLLLGSNLDLQTHSLVSVNVDVPLGLGLESGLVEDVDAPLELDPDFSLTSHFFILEYWNLGPS